MQGTQLRYAIRFVADMEKAVKFYHAVLGLTLKFESPRVFCSGCRPRSRISAAYWHTLQRRR